MFEKKHRIRNFISRFSTFSIHSSLSPLSVYFGRYHKFVMAFKNKLIIYNKHHQHWELEFGELGNEQDFTSSSSERNRITPNGSGTAKKTPRKMSSHFGKLPSLSSKIFSVERVTVMLHLVLDEIKVKNKLFGRMWCEAI